MDPAAAAAGAMAPAVPAAAESSSATHDAPLQQQEDEEEEAPSALPTLEALLCVPLAFVARHTSMRRYVRRHLFNHPIIH